MTEPQAHASDPSSHVTHVDDITRARVAPGLRDAAAHLAQAQEGAADAAAPLYRLMRDIVHGNDIDENHSTLSVVTNFLGLAVRKILDLTRRDSSNPDCLPLARTRALAILEAVTDRDRASIVGKGYMFRIDAGYYARVWPGLSAEDMIDLDLCARLLRAAAIEVCDLGKDDGKAIRAMRELVSMTFDIIGMALP
jgi:hypothetical protein